MSIFRSESGKWSESGIIGALVLLTGVVLVWVAGMMKNAIGATAGAGLVGAGTTLIFKKASKDQAIATTKIQTTATATVKTETKTEVTE